jgi:DNA repair exonuclease SbcCD nuclease subunit
LPFRFIHTADIHLDSPLKSLALRDPELAELIGNATRQAFVNIIDICLAEQVDALLLAGDLYDGDQTSMKTARFLAAQLARLHEAGIRVFIIRGNHDAMSRITRELTPPESVRIFGGRADFVLLPSALGDVAVHGISFAQPHAPDTLLPKYKPPVQGAFNIGLMHTSLDGAPGHDVYAPCSAAKLDDSGFDYWALGHIHKRSELRGRATIVMPGMPQGRDINEAGAKSLSLVTVSDDRSIHIEARTTCVAQFEAVTIDLTGIADWRDMLRAIAASLQTARNAVAAEHLVARLHLHGATPLAWRMRRDADLLRGEAEQSGMSVGRTWIDKVNIDCHAPTEAAATAPDPLAELRRVIGDDILHADSFRAAMADMADELRGQLPHECRGFLGISEQESAEQLAKLAREGAEDVLARLHGSSSAEAA